MSEKIKVGEYVRTKEGYIGKLVEYIPNALNYLKIDIGREIIHSDNSRDNFIYTRYGFQLKHSKDIIGLIEVGDYVNGNIVYEILDDEIELLSGRIRKKRIHFITGHLIDEEEIKSIVAKEQFAEMEYKVNE